MVSRPASRPTPRTCGSGTSRPPLRWCPSARYLRPCGPRSPAPGTSIWTTPKASSPQPSLAGRPGKRSWAIPRPSGAAPRIARYARSPVASSTGTGRKPIRPGRHRGTSDETISRRWIRRALRSSARSPAGSCPPAPNSPAASGGWPRGACLRVHPWHLPMGGTARSHRRPRPARRSGAQGRPPLVPRLALEGHSAFARRVHRAQPRAGHLRRGRRSDLGRLRRLRRL